MFSLPRNWPYQILKRAGTYLLLLNILMPKMNGFELYQQVKNIKDDKVKVCFITAYEIYYRALRYLFPTIEVDCFYGKTNWKEGVGKQK